MTPRTPWRHGRDVLAACGLLPVLWVATACGGSERTATTDSAAGATGATGAPATSAAAGDSGTAGGAAHGGMSHAAAGEAAPRDSNQAFLRMMVDHHQGLVAMTDTAMGKLAGATAKADARALRDKQASEQQRMQRTLGATYSDSHAPTLLPSNRAMLDSVRAAAGAAEADRVWYRQVIAHHREGVRMTDQMMGHLTGDVKQQAERMKSDQQREIAEFERKAGGTR